MPLWALALILTFSGVASIFFSYVYFLLLNFSKGKLMQLAGDGSNGSKNRAEAYLDNLPAILNTVVALEMAVKIVFNLSLYLYLLELFSMDRLTALVPTAALSILWFVFFCRVLPAEVGSFREEQVLLRLLPVLHGISKVLYPILFPVQVFRTVVKRKVVASRAPNETEHSPEEILDAVEEGEREGVIGGDEADMIEAIMELQMREVGDIMTPRMDMVCLDLKTDLDEAVKIAVKIGHSRIPVYEKNRDRIVGVFYVKDVLKHWPEAKGAKPKLADLIRKPFFIPETKVIGELLQEFRDNKVHIAIVLDEYGGTAGLVTNEDILEEIVGEIVDEYDAEEEEELKVLGKGRAEASAKLHLDELNEELKIELPESDDFNTVGGFIFTRLGKVPAKGDHVTYENVKLTVIDADDRRIKRVAIQVQEKEPKVEP